MTNSSNDDAVDLAASVERTRRSYDQTPYASGPIPRAHPGRMAAHAIWRGLDAPEAATARVLEIGCASGGHILPLGAAMPDSSFLGVDLSPVQIAIGERRRERLQLDNVELRAGSFVDLGDADGQFDFIVCHGVYSWIPEPLRDELLRVIRERLAPRGLAMVSFNVLPGWRLYQIARDAMLLHARLRANPDTRAADARFLFEALAAQAPDKNAYGHFWRNEARSMPRIGDDYIAHEVFEEFNTPETFTAFVDRLDAHGLAYLGEADISANNEALLSIEGAATIRELAGDRYLALEQYIDIFSGRTFREALIVRGERSEPIQRHPSVAAITRLHFIPAPNVIVATSSDGQGDLVLARKDARLQVRGEKIAGALRALFTRAPRSSSFDELAPDQPLDPEFHGALSATLAQLVIFGFCAVSTLPAACASVLSAAPEVWRLARVDAAETTQTVSLTHAPVQLDLPRRLLAPLTDGTRTRDQLIAATLDLIERDILRIEGPNGLPLEPAQLRLAATSAVDEYLLQMLRLGMLIEQ